MKVDRVAMWNKTTTVRLYLEPLHSTSVSHVRVEKSQIQRTIYYIDDHSHHHDSIVWSATTVALMANRFVNMAVEDEFRGHVRWTIADQALDLEILRTAAFVSSSFRTE